MVNVQLSLEMCSISLDFFPIEIKISAFQFLASRDFSIINKLLSETYHINSLRQKRLKGYGIKNLDEASDRFAEAI